MAKKIINDGAGRKANANANDLQSIINKAEWEMRRNDAKCANDLAKLYDLQRQIAFGEGPLGKKASITNRKSAIENMIARGEAYATGEAPLLQEEIEAEVIEEAVQEEQEVKRVSNGEPVMSFAEKKAAWAAKMAEKKSEEEK